MHAVCYAPMGYRLQLHGEQVPARAQRMTKVTQFIMRHRVHVFLASRCICYQTLKPDQAEISTSLPRLVCFFLLGAVSLKIKLNIKMKSRNPSKENRSGYDRTAKYAINKSSACGIVSPRKCKLEYIVRSVCK